MTLDASTLRKLREFEAEIFDLKTDKELLQGIRTKLEEKLAVAVKALEFYAQSRFDRDTMSWQNLPEPDKASSVLEQIKQMKAGLK